MLWLCVCARVGACKQHPLTPPGLTPKKAGERRDEACRKGTVEDVQLQSCPSDSTDETFSALSFIRSAGPLEICRPGQVSGSVSQITENFIITIITIMTITIVIIIITILIVVVIDITIIITQGLGS